MIFLAAYFPDDITHPIACKHVHRPPAIERASMRLKCLWRRYRHHASQKSYGMPTNELPIVEFEYYFCCSAGGPVICHIAIIIYVGFIVRCGRGTVDRLSSNCLPHLAFALWWAQETPYATHARMPACACVLGWSLNLVNGTSGDAVCYFYVRANFFRHVHST